jgi:hypothetical protein
VRRRILLFLPPLAVAACVAASPTPDAVQRQQQRQLGYTDWSGLSEAASPAVSLRGRVEVRQAAATATDALPMPTITNMVIRTANASIEVDSLEPAVAALRALAARVGGFIASTAVQAGEGELRSANIEVKVPAARFDEAMTGLKPIGELESSKTQADDVGEEFVDVTARMENAHRLERRLIDLLATRTGKLKDVLDVEQSLARVREEIERYEGRLRYLKAHTAMSTLTVYVHEPVPIVGSVGASVMGEAFKQAWRNFVTFLALFVQSLGVIVPIGALAAAVWFATRRWRVARALPH